MESESICFGEFRSVVFKNILTRMDAFEVLINFFKF